MLLILLQLVGVMAKGNNNLMDTDSNKESQSSASSFMEKTLKRLGDLKNLSTEHVRQLLTLAIRYVRTVVFDYSLGIHG